MKVELPEFKRCCFCVPLRAGLLVWGYIKIIADALITHFLTSLILDAQLFNMAQNSSHAMWVLLTLVTVVMFVTDFVASIVFVVGALMENVKLIRGFYTYSIVALIMSPLFFVLGIFFSISSWRSDTNALNLTLIAGYLMIIVVQAYVILLLRSEVNKLNRSNDFRFVNNPAEAHCVISKEKEAAVEKV